SVGIELLGPLLSGQNTGSIELLLEGFLEVEHRTVVGDGDLDGEITLGTDDDLSGHRWPPLQGERRARILAQQSLDSYIIWRSHPSESLSKDRAAARVPGRKAILAMFIACRAREQRGTAQPAALRSASRDQRALGRCPKRAAARNPE